MSAQIEKRKAILSLLKGNSLEYRVFAKFLMGNLPEYMVSVDDALVLHFIEMQWKLFNKVKNKPLIKIDTVPSLIAPEFSVSGLRLAVNDMPFLVNSIMNVFTELKLNVQALIHSVIPADAGLGKTKDQALVWVELDPLLSKKEGKALCERLLDVLSDVRQSVKDWGKMQGRLKSVIRTWDFHSIFHGGEASQVDELKQFMNWVLEYFTFMGVRYYKHVKNENESYSQYELGSNLGVLSSKARHPKKEWLSNCEAHFPGSKEFSQLFFFTKTNTFSTVHRMAYTDLLVLRRCNKKGEIIGEERFVGLLTSDAYESDPTKIPYIRIKVQMLMDHMSSLSRHLNKQVLFLIKRLPRLELFQASFDDLLRIILKTVSSQPRNEVCSFVRLDVFRRFYSCLIFVPRDLYHTGVRLKIEKLLMRELKGGESYSNPHFAETNMAQLHVIIKVSPQDLKEINPKEIEKKIRTLCMSWQQVFKLKLRGLFSQQEADRLHHLYQDFPDSYKHLYTPLQATHDIISIERLCLKNPLAIDIQANDDSKVSIKLYEINEHRISLSQIVPVLENMGLRLISEHFVGWDSSYKGKVFISHFHAEQKEKSDFQLTELQSIFYEALDGTLKGAFANDALNRLIFKGRIAASDLELLRAYVAYLQQVNFQLSSSIIIDVLCRHYLITKLILKLFHLKFTPGKRQIRQQSKCRNQLNVKLADVSNVYDDRILSALIHLVDATVRTNFYYQNKEALVLKISTRKLSFVPQPKPLFDAFIYSQKCEGIYLRMSRVARGGIRWSFRVLDYRTEVMSLMRAQDVKNALIVPSGAKGGFIAKDIKDSDTLDVKREKGKKAYAVFISSLLQITDNLVLGQVHRPPYLNVYDENDPYLVVAADKGTATFSDLANSIAHENLFWMNDAFASGGSNGYDHKKMAVTANSAWVSVHWHLYEAGRKRPYLSVVGIGDMSGDVFGNGMLKKNLKLIAAFNHNHIFIDPNPDLESSYQERKRLFQKSYSQWTDYDAKVLSKGGGVYSRQVKFIRLSKEAQKALGIREKQLQPSQLIQAILCAPVDLLWNGGIGTYVRSSDERDSEIGDRQNDSCRVDARCLRAKIVGEGGNLGFTQLARIEYSQCGGKINTDFIDNSGGVDCSDHEVNLKILYQTKEDLSEETLSEKSRNSQLKKYGAEIVSLILNNTLRQNIAISMAVDASVHQWELYHRLMITEEKANRLNRDFERLPTNDVMKERINLGLPPIQRPEMALLMCFVKNKVQSELVDASWLDQVSADFLTDMFPDSMKKSWIPYMVKHPLRKQLLATRLSNLIINEGGAAFIQLMQEEFMLSTEEVVRAYILIRRWFRIGELIDLLDQKKEEISATIHLDCLHSITVLLRRGTRWCLKNINSLTDLEKLPSLDLHTMQASINELLTEKQKKKVMNMKRSLIKVRFSENQAHMLSVIRYMHVYLNLIEFSAQTKISFADYVSIYNLIAIALKINQLRDSMFSHQDFNRWNSLHKSAMDGELDRCMKRFCSEVFSGMNKNTSLIKSFEAWYDRCSVSISRWDRMYQEAFDQTNISISFFSVAVNLLSSICDSTQQEGV